MRINPKKISHCPNFPSGAIPKKRGEEGYGSAAQKPYSYLPAPTKLGGVASSDQPKQPYREFINRVTGNYVDIDTNYNKFMFDRQNNVTSKISDQLELKQQDVLKPYTLYLGGVFSGGIFHEKTNEKGRFPILARLPGSHAKSKQDTQTVVNDAAFNATLSLPMITGFVQAEYSEVIYPGQTNWQLRKWHITLGDLNQFPVYAFIGRGTVDFGDMRSYSPFAQSMNNHYLWAQTKKLMMGVGYTQNHTRATFTLIHSGRGLRVVDSPKSEGYDNFAFNLAHDFIFNQDTKLTTGVGYLNSSIYNSIIAHHPPGVGGENSIRNPILSGNIALTWQQFDVGLEYGQSAKRWPATEAKVSAVTLQGRYRTQIVNLPTRFYTMLSRGRQGGADTAWERMSSGLIGAEVDLNNNLSIGGEVIRHLGFVPLIMPKVASSRSTRATSFVGGAKFTF